MVQLLQSLPQRDKPWRMQLSALLEQVGFRVAKVQLSVFFPPSFARYERLFQMSKQLESLAGRMPLLRNLGGIYTIVARK
jgi:hypothetical protein